jgi:hypothetical protein
LDDKNWLWTLYFNLLPHILPLLEMLLYGGARTKGEREAVVKRRPFRQEDLMKMRSGKRIMWFTSSPEGSCFATCEWRLVVIKSIINWSRFGIAVWQIQLQWQCREKRMLDQPWRSSTDDQPPRTQNAQEHSQEETERKTVFWCGANQPLFWFTLNFL